MRTQSLYALVAAGLLAGGLSVSSANAADLGGNCCADLEERIAELEATTARKGNRKVSLTVSGWVGQQIMYWDDGFESNTYVHDIGTTIASHVKFTGSAQIAAGWSAGYVLQLEAIGSDSLGISQTDSAAANLVSGDDRGVSVLQSYWFVKSDQLGKVSVGLQSHASDNTAILVDGSGSLVPANFVQFDYGFFQAKTAAGPAGNAGIWLARTGCTDCNGIPLNSVRYDSPTFGGFSVSASWGEDDFWDIAARYAGEHHGFKLAVAGAYSESTDGVFPMLQPDGTDFWQIGAYVQHVATGLFLYGAYTDIDSDNGNAVDNDMFYLKAGIRTKLNHLGATVFYGEYESWDNNAGGGSIESELFGLGIVQEVDAAAMSVWLKYRNISDDTDNSNIEDFDYVGLGGLINF